MAELDVLQLDCQILDMIGDVGRQWLRIWSVNNFSRHFGLVLFLASHCRCIAMPVQKAVAWLSNTREHGQAQQLQEAKVALI
jgi:hypothetical protein